MEATIEDIKAFVRGKEGLSIVYVQNFDDPKYKTMDKLVSDIWPESDGSMYQVGQHISDLFTTLRYMEPVDYEKIVSTVKKYQVSGEAIPVRGHKTYGFDRSRVDRKLIRRKRGN
jgi:hypothetical protein